jgi:hypothetical protein
MEKLIYVLWKPPGESDANFQGAMRGPVADRLFATDVAALSINLVDEHVAHALAVRMTHHDPPVAGTMSLWLPSVDARAACEDILAAANVRHAGYLVTERIALQNPTPPARPGERTPGINMVALLERPARLTHAAWLDHWERHHERVAIETQCTFAYVRNIVRCALTPQAPPWAGIVEEGFPVAAVTDPMLWYRSGGSKDTMRRNLARMVESVRAFLDVDRVESHPMSEYRFVR